MHCSYLSFTQISLFLLRLFVEERTKVNTSRRKRSYVVWFHFNDIILDLNTSVNNDQMGSERLGHMFAQKDPAFKEIASSNTHENQKPLSHHSLSHTSGTQPVCMSNGPSSSSKTPMIKHKINPKYKKLLKLYHRQLTYISTTLNAIESVSTTDHFHSNPMLISSRQRLDHLYQTLDNFRNSPNKQDQPHFDSLKTDIDQLVDDIKSYKTKHSTSHTLDHLIGFPLDVSDSDNDEPSKTLIYF